MTYSVAIIEDVDDMISLYEELFVEYIGKVDIKFFKNGIEALQTLESVRYDLIICDLNLPDLHGSEIIKRLRRNSPNSSSLIFVVSGFIDSDTIKFCTESKDIKRFSKPVEGEFAENCWSVLETRKKLNYDPEVIETLRNSAYELLSSYFDKNPVIGRCQLNPINAKPDSKRGFITFKGGDFEGYIGVDLGQGFIERFRSKTGVKNDSSDEDIAYEMANELAGVFKSSALKKGYKLDIGIPQVLKLKELQLRRPKDHIVVYIPAGYVGALFRIEFSMTIPDFSHTSPTENTNSLGSGEVLLFG